MLLDPVFEQPNVGERMRFEHKKQKRILDLEMEMREDKEDRNEFEMVRE
jgi:hypothetical protein